jgi:hypothetical protein
MNTALRTKLTFETDFIFSWIPAVRNKNRNTLKRVSLRSLYEASIFAFLFMCSICKVITCNRFRISISQRCPLLPAVCVRQKCDADCGSSPYSCVYTFFCVPESRKVLIAGGRLFSLEHACWNEPVSSITDRCQCISHWSKTWGIWLNSFIGVVS